MQSSGSEDTTRDRSKSGSDLLQYCNTLKQEQAVTLVYIEGMTKAAAARELGIDRKSLKERLEQVERRAENGRPSRTVNMSRSGARVGIIGDTHLPYELDGAEGRSARLARQIGVALGARTGLPIHYQDERYSTVEASRKLTEQGLNSRQQRSVIDQAAAAVILQDWLDAQAAQD